MAVASPAAVPVARAQGALLTPALDAAFLGGLSLFVPLGILVMLAAPGMRPALSRLEHWLALAIVLPHFLSSYQLLYWDQRERLGETKRLGATVAVPLALAAAFGALYAGKPILPLWALVHGMFLLSGWHYLKQAFGCSVVGCAIAGAPLTGEERTALQRNLWALGALAFLAPNALSRGFVFVGVPYSSLPVPTWLLAASASAALATLAKLVLVLKKRGGLPVPAAVSLGAFYLWALPVVVNPDYFYTYRFVPFAAVMHSLQYLTFVGPLRWRSDPRPARFMGGWLALALLGPALFYRLPTSLDHGLAYDHSLLGPAFFLAAVHLFVNIHHYFIDAVIWRRDNADLAALVEERRAAARP